MVKRVLPLAAVVVCLSGCAGPAVSAAPATPATSATPGQLGGFDPARKGSADMDAALKAGLKDGRHVLTVFGGNDNADCRALALLSGDPAVAPLLADYHVVLVDVGDPGPNLESDRLLATRMFLDLKTSGIPAVVVTKSTGGAAEDLFASNDGSFAHARSMTPAQLAAFLEKWR